MKKIIYNVIPALLFLFSAFTADADERIDVSQLPKETKAFVTQYFPGTDIIYAERDFSKKTGAYEYEVKLSDGTEIDFYSDGKWKEVSCSHAGIAVPSSIIPASIAEYVKNNYPSLCIKEIKKKRYGYDVELSNDLDIEFDTAGKFLRID